MTRSAPSVARAFDGAPFTTPRRTRTSVAQLLAGGENLARGASRRRRQSVRACALTTAFALLALLLCTATTSHAQMLNPGGSPYQTYSGIFRQQTSSIPTYAPWPFSFSQSDFQSNWSTICGTGYTLLDVDIDASSQTLSEIGAPLYTPLCEAEAAGSTF